ncbi:hypothetical protein PCH_Pc21g09370 [Penicillium rubens Wisconsin 54-1255]|uniref:Uncharacterized protein n=1 Tax=Penicillium rubens (strain ATCC 28089 / DSM 1075 / NRRL 1951 / Wisconsin 54-1255) TaxID=500485 RepID=B6HN97_PENRW|nr:hypothetical protein PCH_Pc21g09370 [Penicillium rubens Wisconsin 54-1255]
MWILCHPPHQPMVQPIRTILLSLFHGMVSQLTSDGPTKSNEPCSKLTTWEPRAWTSDVPVSYRKQSLRQAHLNIYIIYSWSFAVTNGGEETSSDGDRRGMTVHTFSPRDPPNEPRAPNSTFDDAFLQNPVNTHIQTMRIFFHFLENRIPRDTPPDASGYQGDAEVNEIVDEYVDAWMSRSSHASFHFKRLLDFTYQSPILSQCSAVSLAEIKNSRNVTMK